MNYGHNKEPITNMLAEFESVEQAVAILSMFHNYKFRGKFLHVSFAKQDK